MAIDYLLTSMVTIALACAIAATRISVPTLLHLGPSRNVADKELREMFARQLLRHHGRLLGLVVATALCGGLLILLCIIRFVLDGAITWREGGESALGLVSGFASRVLFSHWREINKQIRSMISA